MAPRGTGGRLLCFGWAGGGGEEEDEVEGAGQEGHSVWEATDQKPLIPVGKTNHTGAGKARFSVRVRSKARGREEVSARGREGEGEGEGRTFVDDEPDERIVGLSSESSFDSLAAQVEINVDDNNFGEERGEEKEISSAKVQTTRRNPNKTTTQRD